jgi:hypothetical protein
MDILNFLKSLDEDESLGDFDLQSFRNVLAGIKSGVIIM